MGIATRKAKAHLDKLQFNFDEFTMMRFVGRVEQVMGRRIFLFAITMPPTMDGAWISDADRPFEYVFFDRQLAPLHQAHTQLHEIGHILFEHETLKVSDRNLSSLIEAVQKQTAAPHFLMRAMDKKLPREEIEAETIAMMIQTRIIRASRTNILSQSLSHNAEVDRYLSDMGIS
jgi:hypothetical protein